MGASEMRAVQQTPDENLSFHDRHGGTIGNLHPWPEAFRLEQKPPRP